MVLWQTLTKDTVFVIMFRGNLSFVNWCHSPTKAYKARSHLSCHFTNAQLLIYLFKATTKKNDVSIGLKAPKAADQLHYGVAVTLCLSQKWNYASLWLALLCVKG